MLLGREAQQRALSAVFARTVVGHGRPVVLTGPRGSGFTALLDDARRTAAAPGAGWLVLAARAARDEADLDHALLHQVVVPLLDELGDDLDAAPRASLEAAVGLRAAPPDQVPVSMAALTALDLASRRRPVLVVVDDVPWADAASAAVLRFLCRRLSRSAVCLLLAAPGGTSDGAGWATSSWQGDGDGLDWAQSAEVVPLPPLTTEQSLAWVDAEVPDLDPVDRVELVRLAAGLPRRLADLLRLVRAQVSGRFVLDATPLPSTVRARVVLAARPPSARRALLARGLLADAAGGPHLDDVQQRLALQAGERPAPAPPEVAELLRDPLLAELAVADADPADVVAARAAWVVVLQEAAARPRTPVGPGGTAVRLAAEAARQRALASPGADTDLAGELRTSARAMRPLDARRSGDLFELAAGAEPRPDLRADDLLHAAEQALVLGRRRHAADLAERAHLADPAGRVGGAQARWLALTALAAGDHGGAAEHLADSLARSAAASAAVPGSGQLAEDALATGAALVLLAGRRTGGVDAVTSAVAALPPGPAAELRCVANLCQPWELAVPEEQRRALTGLLEALRASPIPLYRWAAQAGRLLGCAGEVAAACHARLPSVGATGPAAVDLHLALAACSLELSGLESAREHVRSARAAVRHAPEQAVAVTQEEITIGCLAGEDPPPDDVVAAALADDTPERAGVVWACAHRHRQRGEMDAAFSALLELWPPAGEPAGAPALMNVLLLVHALRESGAPLEQLRGPVAQVAAWAAGSGAPVALTTDLVCRAALVDDPQEQRELLERAVGAAGGDLGVAGPPLLALGMLLRRSRRGVTSREPLRAALRSFEGAGFSTFADQARRELDATAPQRPPRPMGSSELTSQERAVADLAALRISNAEIARSLGISSRTVAHHLQRVYAKLGITGRHQLPVRAAGR